MKKGFHKEIRTFRRVVTAGYKEYVIVDPDVYKVFIKDDPKHLFVVDGNKIVGYLLHTRP